MSATCRRTSTSCSPELRDRLEVTSLPIKPKIFDKGKLEKLPASVQRYFRVVLEDGQSPQKEIPLSTGTPRGTVDSASVGLGRVELPTSRLSGGPRRKRIPTPFL